MEANTYPLQKDICDQIADKFLFTKAERRHLNTLAAISRDEFTVDAPDPDADYSTAIDREKRALLHDLGPIASAWLNDRWSVLASNHAFRSTFPGAAQAPTILHWMFLDPRSRYVLLNWESEAWLLVTRFRGMMGYYRSPAWLIDLLDQLSTSPEFIGMWNSHEVHFDRHRADVQLRTLDDDPYTLSVRIMSTLTDQRARLLHMLGIAHPYRGGRQLLIDVGIGSPPLRERGSHQLMSGLARTALAAAGPNTSQWPGHFAGTATTRTHHQKTE